MAEFKTNVTFPLPPSVIEKLDKLAFNEKVSRAEIGRRIIDEYLTRRKKEGNC